MNEDFQGRGKRAVGMLEYKGDFSNICDPVSVHWYMSFSSVAGGKRKSVARLSSKGQGVNMNYCGV